MLVSGFLTKIEASAGSGKTSRLAYEYLLLLFRNYFAVAHSGRSNEYPESVFREMLNSILAITFTNKATNEMKNRILGQLKKVIPDLEHHLILTLSATSYTSYRYTLNSQGAMLGWAMTPDQLGAESPSNETPIENLYLAGHWTRPGGGITPVIISAQKVADLILSKQDFKEAAEAAAVEMNEAYADSEQRQ